jgi:hypothetical protein
MNKPAPDRRREKPMNATVLKTVLVLVAAAGMTACASTPSTTAADQIAKVDPGPNRHCVETGSRIAGTCNPGQSYSREEIERTGGLTLSESLSRLSPALTRH